MRWMLLHLLMAGFGMKQTFYACRRMSVLGGKAVMQRTSPQGPGLTHSGHRDAFAEREIMECPAAIARVTPP
jgi:hypothetical protein